AVWPMTERCPRAATLWHDFRHKTAKVACKDLHNPVLASNFEGNVETIPGGDQMVGWGQQPYFTQFNSRGKMVFDGRFTAPINSYRAYRFRWTGFPTTQPRVATKGGKKTITVYASWNGSNVVKNWRVLGGASPQSLR